MKYENKRFISMNMNYFKYYSSFSKDSNMCGAYILYVFFTVML